MEALNGVEYPQHCGQRMKARAFVAAAYLFGFRPRPLRAYASFRMHATLAEHAQVMYAEPAAASGSRAPGSRVGIQAAAARVVPSDSVESAAYAGLRPQLGTSSNRFRDREWSQADVVVISLLLSELRPGANCR